MVRNTTKKEGAINLRKRGKSYNEIQNKLKISKGTLSYWFKNDDLSIRLKKRLTTKNRINAKIRIDNLSMINRKNHSERVKRYKEEAKKQFDKLKNDPLFLLGLSLYWGEGLKNNKGVVGLCNTDPKMILLIKKFYTDILNVDTNKLRVGLFVYENEDIESIKKFWSDLIKISTTQFIKVQVLKSRSKLTKNKSRYGICNLYFSNTKLNTKILEWISLIAESYAGIA